MKIFKSFLFLLLTCFIMPDPSHAIPAFAKKYGFNCNMCHTGFTKLNDFGTRYRDNGYQLPGQVNGEKTIFDTPPPIAMRTSTGLVLYDGDHGSTAGFNIFGFDLLASGVMHKNISFLVIYTPRIDEPAVDFAGPGDGNRPSQNGGLESVNLVFSNVIKDVLNIRVGRFEPAYHIFSSKRKYHIFTPYEIYSFNPSNLSYNFDDNQMGVEATGHFSCGFKYGLGLVNGTGANPDNNVNKDVYVNLSQTFGKGDGQSAGQRIGVFGYLGRQPLRDIGTIIAPTGETNGSGKGSFSRIGVDGSFNYRTLNLQGLYMSGVDDATLNPWEAKQDYKYTGGLIELDWAGLANNRIVTSLLYNWASPPSYNKERKVNSYSLLLRYYLGDWSAVNVSLHAEYMHKQTGDIVKSKDNIMAMMVDFAF